MGVNPCKSRRVALQFATVATSVLKLKSRIRKRRTGSALRRQLLSDVKWASHYISWCCAAFRVMVALHDYLLLVRPRFIPPQLCYVCRSPGECSELEGKPV
jgi:hypothetical protein